MSWDPDLNELLVDSVTLVAPGAMNFYTEQAASGAGAVYVCKVDGQVKMIRDAMARERVSMVQVYLNELIDGLAPDWIVTLPSRYTPASPPIIAIETSTDEDGGHHTVIYC